MSDGIAGGVSGMNDSTPLATSLSRHYGTSNQYGSDPNHPGFTGGMFESMKTGVQTTIGLKQMQNFLKNPTSGGAISQVAKAAARADPGTTIWSHGDQP